MAASAWASLHVGGGYPSLHMVVGGRVALVVVVAPKWWWRSAWALLRMTVIWQVSVLLVHHSTNVYRCDLNSSASTLGPNDLTGAFRGVPQALACSRSAISSFDFYTCASPAPSSGPVRMLEGYVGGPDDTGKSRSRILRYTDSLQLAALLRLALSRRCPR